MKRMVSLMLLTLVVSVSATVYAGTPIKSSELPAAAQKFLSKHFPGDNVRKAEKDQGRRGMEYEVDLTSGAEVEFNADGGWKEVKAARGNSVPSAIVPAGIAKHVAANYSKLTIVEISRKRGGYKVELSNGSELLLTEDGKAMQPRQGGGRSRH